MNAIKILVSFIIALFWTVVPHGPDRPFQRRGLRIVKHTPYMGGSVVWCLYAGSGAGYIGGATAYVGFGCQGDRGLVRLFRQRYTRRPRLALGATKNANHVPLP